MASPCTSYFPVYFRICTSWSWKLCFFWCVCTHCWVVSKEFGSLCWEWDMRLLSSYLVSSTYIFSHSSLQLTPYAMLLLRCLGIQPFGWTKCCLSVFIGLKHTGMLYLEKTLRNFSNSRYIRKDNVISSDIAIRFLWLNICLCYVYIGVLIKLHSG